MFTGIVEELGKVRSVQKSKNAYFITICAPDISKDIQIGDSISVNGICLTVTKQYKNNFEADIMPETLRQTNLRNIRLGDMVNLERALKLSSRLGGHMVSGHIDGVGRIISRKKEGNATILKIKMKPQFTKLLVPKGSVAIDGVSLTVMDILRDSFCVSIIPHTSKTTTLNLKRQGDVVNIETDLVAKHVKKLLSGWKENITFDMLREFGHTMEG